MGTEDELYLLKLGSYVKCKMSTGEIRKVINHKLSMQNEAGEFVDMYIPRKCSASNRIIAAKDHASIQLNIADVDESTGRMTGSNTTYAICGTIRRMGESDDSLNRLAKRDNILAKNF